MKKLKNKIREVKKFIKMYILGLMTTLCLFQLLDYLRYKNSIYYHDRLKLTDQELEELEENLCDETGLDIDKDDNAIILDAVIKNDNLTDEEKEFIYGYSELLNDNPYLDKSEAYNNLQKVDIIYNEDLDYGDDVMGIYDGRKNRIEIKEETKNQAVLSHEVIHCIYDNDYYYNNPNFFDEGMTELLSNEYFEEEPFKEEMCYPFEIIMVKTLCEVVGEDVVLEAYSKESVSIVEKKIEEVTHLSNSKELISSMENISKCVRKNIVPDEKDINNVLIFLETYCDRNIKDDLEKQELMNYYIDNLKLLREESPIFLYETKLITDGYYVKAYFSKKLKEKYPDVIHVDYEDYIEGKSNKIYQKSIEYNV